jgi:hypothetical protein
MLDTDGVEAIIRWRPTMSYGSVSQELDYSRHAAAATVAGAGHRNTGCQRDAFRFRRARELVEYLQTSYRISIRRACGALRFDRSTYHYWHRRPEQTSLRKRIRELSEARVRYGHRRIHVLLRREGWTINHKRTRRLYREEGLQLRRKTPKRKVSAKRREDRVVAIEMPALRHTSSAWCRMKAICCSLNRDCFISKTPRLPNGQTYWVFLTQNGPVFRAHVRTPP